MNYFVECLKKYATFSGRARRKEFWLFMLGFVIVYFVAAILDGMMSGGNANAKAILSGLVWLALLLPSIAVTVRRLHDTDRTGWWALIGITMIGCLVLLVFACMEGTKGDNRFGEDPKLNG